MKSKNMLATNGKEERQSEDFYATNPKALELLIQTLEKYGEPINNTVWECAVGQGHLAQVLEKKGYKVYKSDIVDRGCNAEIKDFLEETKEWAGDILTNPPFIIAERFIEKAMELLQNGHRLYLFLKIQFLESKSRKMLFEKFPPKYVYINSERQHTAKNGDFEKYTLGTLCFCWFVWEKGFNGEPIIRWI